MKKRTTDLPAGALKARPASSNPVRSYLLPHAPAHRSATVRRELLYVAESGEWQDCSGTEHLAERVASYIEAERVVLCADVTGGFATLRAHHSGRVAVLGSSVPDDIAATLNGGSVGWSSLLDPLPADVEMVYIPPVTLGSWRSPAPEQVAEAAGRYPNVPFVVDERWFEYSGISVAEYLQHTDNLIILRSLGPAFGLDGLGMGYMLASQRMLPEGLARAAEAVLLPVSRRAAWVALVDLGYCQEYVNTRLTTRSWIARALGELGFEAIELPGPHLFVKGDLPNALKRESDVQSTQGGWLWAIGTPDQVEDQLASLETRRAAVHA